MGTLYMANSYSTLAVYENGVVYNDSWKTRVLGTYSGGAVYSGSGMYSSYVGSYSGGNIKGRGYLATVEGYISGNTVYCGSNRIYSTRVATFSGDEEGAAAAALLLGLFNEAHKNATSSSVTDTPSLNATYHDYGHVPVEPMQEDSLLFKIIFYPIAYYLSLWWITVPLTFLMFMFWDDWKAFFIGIGVKIAEFINTSDFSLVVTSVLICLIIFFYVYNKVKKYDEKEEDEEKRDGKGFNYVTAFLVSWIISIVIFLILIIVETKNVNQSILTFNFLCRALIGFLYTHLLLLFSVMICVCIIELVRYIRENL